MRKFPQSGITLMELMITVAIVGILAAIAYPNYRQQVMRSNRTEAKIALQQNAQALESCFTQFNSYDDPTLLRCTVANTLKAAAGIVTPNSNYRVNVDFGAASPSSTFTLTATPLGGQVADSKCMNFTLQETNLQGRSGTGTVAECWGK